MDFYAEIFLIIYVVCIYLAIRFFLKSIFKGYSFKRAQTFEALSKQKPRDFEVQCVDWLRRNGYKAERLKFYKRYEYVPDDNKRYILVMNKQKKDLGLGRCKIAKSGISIKDIDIFVEDLQRHGQSRGWYFSLYGYSEKIYKYVSDLKVVEIKLIKGLDVIK